MLIKKLPLIPLTLALVCATSLAQQPSRTQADLSRLTGEVLWGGEAYQNLEYLTDRIGPRVTGSAGEAQALAWTLEKFKSYGYANAHRESVEVPHRWERVSAEAAIVTPITRRIDVASYGWAVGTPGEITAPVVPLTEIKREQFETRKSS